ncbi:MAG TPA: adenosylcobinamide-phosphate synthase CbiB [bacterium]|jgi:adenosylcobinamide-phosphate synthase|nr:adenosylcobinamide-phosphate synthase CbiB [bacterium]
MIQEHALALALALVLDFFLGDMESLPHPVRWMGQAYARFERMVRREKAFTYENGMTAVLLIVVLFSVVPGAILYLIPPGMVHVAVEGFLLYWCLSVKTLADESFSVYQALQKKRLPLARQLLARVVGRDTQKLPPSEIARGVVETLGESFVDGFLSPIFWGLILGAPGAYFFKAVSTGDSMIGHPEEPYRRFGWAAARLDDALNWIPARLCVLFLVPAALVCGQSPRGLLRAFKKDRLKHASPNAAHGEAAFAGALGVRLGGVNYYGGKTYRQAFLNPTGRACEARDILRGVSLLWVSALGVLLMLLLLGGVSI